MVLFVRYMILLWIVGVWNMMCVVIVLMLFGVVRVIVLFVEFNVFILCLIRLIILKFGLKR